MMLGVATPPPAEVGEPTWYLVWDVAGTWAGALFTAAATIVALWLGLKANRDQQIQMEAQDRVQAERVTLRQGRDALDGRYYLELRNDSDLPIGRVFVVCEDNPRSDLLGILPVLDAHSTFKFPLDSVEYVHKLAAAEFDDASGRAWIRTIDGKLRRVVRDVFGTSLRITFHNGVRWSPGPRPPYKIPLSLTRIVRSIRRAPFKPDRWAASKHWFEWDLGELKRRRAVRREARRDRREARRVRRRLRRMMP